jgi:hypothetical protein
MRPAQEVAASRPLRRFKASGWPVPDPRKPSLVPGAISGRGFHLFSGLRHHFLPTGRGAPQVGPADYLAVLPTGARRADNNLVSAIT